jgi:hypothetical protein
MLKNSGATHRILALADEQDADGKSEPKAINDFSVLFSAVVADA